MELWLPQAPCSELHFNEVRRAYVLVTIPPTGTPQGITAPIGP